MAITDDLGDHGCSIASIARVDLLDYLLSPLMLEVDVDVRRLLALLADEAFEQQVVDRRVDRGDAQAIADRAVRRAIRSSRSIRAMSSPR